MAHTASTTMKSTLSGIALFAIAVASTPAWATPDVTLTSGQLTLEIGLGFVLDSHLTAIGPEFFLTAGSGSLGFLPPGCDPCLPGDTFRATTGITGASGGSVTYQGVSAPITDAGLPGTAFVSWSVNGSSFLLPPLGDPFTVIEPFSIDIEVRFVGTHSLVDALGEGLATFTFAQGPPFVGGSPQWRLTSGVYEIEVVPEPGTWLFLATGLIGVMGLARKRTRGTSR